MPPLNKTIIEMLPGFTKGLKEGPSICEVAVTSSPRGIFYKENPLLESYNLFALQIILLVLAYRAVYFLLRPLKQTKFVCSVVAGILIGPNMLGKLHIFGERGLFPEKELLITGTMGALGIAYFIFLVAVKMDLSMLRRTAKEATVIGTLSVLVPFACTITATFLLPMMGMQKDFFRFLFSAGISVTRFANVADVANELNMLTSQQGQLLLSSTMLNELFTWTALVSGICYRNPNNPLIPFLLLLSMLGVGIVTVSVKTLALKIIAKAPKGVPVNERLITSILIIALWMAFFTNLIGSLHVGMLVMGLIMPDGPPLGSAIVERAEYMVMEFLMPVFYVQVGYGTDLSSFDVTKFWEVTVFVTVSFAAKFLATLLGALACRQNHRDALLLALMVNVKGPIDLYLFMRWKISKNVAPHTHVILVLSNVMVTALVTPLIERLYNDCQKTNASDRQGMKAIQTSSISAEFKIMCCVHNVDNVPGIISLLEASNGSTSSKLSAVVIHLNDLVGRAAPLLVRNDKLKRNIDKNQSDKVAHEFETYTRKLYNPIALTNFTLVAPYKAMHENICHLAKTEGTTLIILPYRKVQGDEAGASQAVVAQATAIRNLNCDMLAHNPCAVGILANKGLGRCLGHDSFSCNVAVIFTGGHDDREALAYATRLLMHSSVRVTLLRLITRWQQVYAEDMMEKKLDNRLVEEFKIKKTEDTRAKYYEEAIVDILGLFNAIRSLGDHYNLVIAGRQSPQIMSMCDEWSDTQDIWGGNPELGIIGDFIASDDYNESKSSALIIQRYPSDDVDVQSKKRYVKYEDERHLLGY
ncbi:cation/H(+) antiporter 15-like [Punica granatum]|uniref:Cation/H(+) antiporter 15-like n=1 Tax=Punica granatum TaxID=22663 RepID=A0A6P8C4Q8_PUNGR|nr:cation/H(+) antiporter 15-like [Punica granatum]